MDVTKSTFPSPKKYIDNNAMLVEGKLIAERVAESLREEIRRKRLSLTLTDIITQDNPVVERFIRAKMRFAELIGVQMLVERLKPMEGADVLLSKILHLTKTSDGIIVQTPFSPHITAEDVYHILPVTHDVDVLGTTAYAQFRDNQLPILPPVVGAVQEILRHYGHSVTGKKIAVIGAGKLVGAPVTIWVERMGAHVQNASTQAPDIMSITKDADIVVLGAGSPGLLKPDMVKEGVIILDAGTSEAEGQLLGDADPACAEKALLMTPTPGGIGPVTVAMLFKNLLTLHQLRTEGDTTESIS